MNGSRSIAAPRFLLSLALAALILLAFWQVQYNDFVNYDDYRYVLENSQVRRGITREGIVWAFTNLEAGFWHPLTWLSHMLDCHLYGIQPKGHHWQGLLFHLANSLLLFLVLDRMTGRTWHSWFVAALFALHPLHVESVAWVSQRKDMLSTLFWIITIWAYVRYVSRPGPRTYLLSFFLFSLGLMSKSMLVTLPFVLVLLDYWPLGRIRSKHEASAGALRYTGLPLRIRSASLSQVLLEKLPFLIIALASGLLTLHAEGKIGALPALDSYPVETRLSTALIAYASYITKMLWPAGLGPLYLHPGTWPFPQVLVSSLLLLSISVIVGLKVRSLPYLAVGWLWYMGTMLPVVGLIQIGSHAMADRYTYIPLIGLFMIVSWGLGDMCSRSARLKPLLTTAMPALLCLLVILTHMQVKHWKNSRTLFERAVAVTEDNYMAYKNLAFVLAMEGRFKEAAENYREALRIRPEFLEALFGLANVLEMQGRKEEAMTYYARVIEINPALDRPYYHLANILLSLGKTEEAITLYQKVLQIDPGNPVAHNNLGIDLERQGRVEEALHHYKEALRLNPSDEKARHNLQALSSSFTPSSSR